MIDFCVFGKIFIDGRDYVTDLKIYPDGSVNDSWTREKGHIIQLDDIIDILAECPDVIIAGTGMNGMAKPDEGLKEELSKKGIEFFALENREAVKRYNQLKLEKRTAACFHLTC